MKTAIATLLMLALAASPSIAGDWEDALRGGLLGAAVGAIVGHNSSDIDTAVAVPALAAAGALLGYAYDRDGYYYDDGYRRRGYNPYGYTRHGDGYSDYRDSDRYWYRPFHYRPYRRMVEPPPSRRAIVTPRSRTAPAAAPTADLHPGVSILRVPVTLPSGTTVALRVLKVNDRYIGPRGESYDEAPTPELLRQRYLGGGDTNTP